MPLGSISPRLLTPPLRPLSPETSYGFAVILFARDVLGEPLDPWQQHAAIRIGELLPDGRPRFRQILLIVARQQGKTHLLKVLALYWMWVERQPLIFGTSTNLDQAREAWLATVETAQRIPTLAVELPRTAVRSANGQETLCTVHRCRYKIGAANRRGGRGKAINRLIGDELREHRTWEAYAAAYPAMNADPSAQAVFLTNQGDATSVVLLALRAAALEFIESGTGDPRLGILEWSAPEGTHPMDPAGWAAACPQLGRRMDYDTIRGVAARVSRPGVDPEELATFLTEYLCMSVPNLDPAIDPIAWHALAQPDSLADLRGRLAACLDISPDARHAALVVAAVQLDGRVRVEVVKAWHDLQQLRRDLPAWVARVRPYTLGWFPRGPAAALDADLRDRRAKDKRYREWPPRGVHVQELSADAPAVCMGFAEQVAAARIVHSGQELLDAHVLRAEKIWTAQRWVFGAARGHVNTAYAAAGAVHLARTMPAARTGSRTVRVPGQAGTSPATNPRVRGRSVV